MPDEVIKEEFVDIVIKGEGEYALQDAIKKIIKKESLSSVNGIWCKERIKDIDKLPFPKRHSEFIKREMY